MSNDILTEILKTFHNKEENLKLVVSDRNLLLVLKQVTDIVIVGTKVLRRGYKRPPFVTVLNHFYPLKFIVAHCNDILADLS